MKSDAWKRRSCSSRDRDSRDRRAHAPINAGFEQMEDDLWRKDGVWFGRDAVLQYAWARPHENGGTDTRGLVVPGKKSSSFSTEPRGLPVPLGHARGRRPR